MAEKGIQFKKDAVEDMVISWKQFKISRKNINMRTPQKSAPYLDK